jgi:hypothetical protein
MRRHYGGPEDGLFAWNNGTCRHECLGAENTAGLDAVSHDVDALGNDVTLSQPCEEGRQQHCSSRGSDSEAMGIKPTRGHGGASARLHVLQYMSPHRRAT